jgi:hypothetical protein
MIKLPAAFGANHAVHLQGAFPVVAAGRAHSGHSFNLQRAQARRLGRQKEPNSLLKDYLHMEIQGLIEN